MTDKSEKTFVVIFYFVLIAAVAVGLILYLFWNRSVEYADRHVEGAAMGTVYSIRIHDFPKNNDWDKFAVEIQSRLDRIEQSMSLFRSDSEVSRFNESESLDWFSVSSDLARVVQISLEISALSGGAFDITSAPMVTIWGFGAERKRRSINEISGEISKLKDFVGYEKLSVRLEPPAIKKSVAGLKIDLSAIAKGYAVDDIARLCDDSGFKNYMIEIGGEICCKGNKGDLKTDANVKVGGVNGKKFNDWKVGIESPAIIPRGEWGGVYQVIAIGDQGMATSGGNRNFHIIEGKYYSHLIDPRTGFPSQIIDENNLSESGDLGLVSVIDKSCTRADALATAFFILGESEGLKIANEHKIPVLFLIRQDKKIRETVSDS
ncbi:MAG: FAD:protein FMN transferase, partial [Planctomycetaceae bacterium]|nr:FAD:protein FMN transferase [Planctomycetaceae bacterium]